MPPAMGVTVFIVLVVQKHTTLVQQFNNSSVGLHDMLAAKILGVFQINTIARHRVVDLQTVLLTDDEIVLTVSWSRVHGAGTGFRCNVLSQYYRHTATQKWMAQLLVFQGGTLALTENLKFRHAKSLTAALSQILSQHQRPAICLDQHIVEFRVNTDSHAGRQSPGRCGPDRNGYFAFISGATRSIYRLGIHRHIGHIYRRRVFVLVLNLGLGKRRTAVHTPVNGLEAFVQVTVGYNARERAYNVRLILEVHGQVGVRPMSQHPHADEVFALRVDLARCVFAAFLSELSCRNLYARFTNFFLHIQFNRQAVTIPTRHIGRVITP